MQRFKLNAKVTRTLSHFEMTTRFQSLAVMEEHPSGEWVRWSDVQALKEHLESRIPEIRFAWIEKALGLVSEGKCPECGQPVRDWEPPFGSLAPEIWATLREKGIDPSTGHRAGCSLRSPRPTG